MNKFAYAQTIFFFKEDMNKIYEDNWKVLILEQDGMSSHRSKKTLRLFDLLLGENGRIQNPTNSPELEYPIEDLWSITKSRVKWREPCSIEELKKYLIEEWNSITLNQIQNLCKNYLYRINKY